MPEFTDTASYPVFATKKALLKAFQAMFEPTGTDWLAFAARLSNTDLTGLADGATIYDPGDVWESAV